MFRSKSRTYLANLLYKSVKIFGNLQLEQKLLTSHTSLGAGHLDTHGILTTEQRDMTNNLVLSCGGQPVWSSEGQSYSANQHLRLLVEGRTTLSTSYD